ncbi:formylglycine-generating enzyme family protein [Leucothrix sargassi]|nr:formylglycine-generating enzyme family protein [Leucothrix sargassi]
MTNKHDSDQTLIPKDEDQQWLKVLHGEKEADDESDTQLNAKVIRDYLIIRDEAEAVNSRVNLDELSAISEQEARVIYRETAEEIRRRGKSNVSELFKTYGMGIVIGILLSTSLYLYFNKGQQSSTSVLQSEEGGVAFNFSDYTVLQEGEALGPWPNMLLIPGGTFNIGCNKGWDDAVGGCRSNEFPPQTVSVKTFEISQHEVTVGQFKRFIDSTGYVTDAEQEARGCVFEDVSAPGRPYVMNSELTWRNPGYEQLDEFPVSCISWEDAQRYISWLNEEQKSTYRLPTEVEWEYAARGGQSTAFFWGSEPSHDQANYQGVGGKDRWTAASPVGQFPANKFSVQDTAGNLWEWVQDCWHDSYRGAPTDGSAWTENCLGANNRVRRGGAWDTTALAVRSANRSPGAKHDRSNLYGFRIARDWQKPN